MDSVTQFALGAALGVAVVGKRAPVWRAALWGGVCGTLPDLDVMIDRGDPIRAMTMHRTTTHALFYQSLAAPVIGWLIARLQRDGLFWRWTLVAWLALITHPLLDLLTVYGTQLGLPFTDYPFYTGSVFVIDPVVTLALLAGLAIALVRGPPGLRWNQLGLGLACVYLAWGLYAQSQVQAIAERSLAAAGIKADRILVSPTPFNTVLWRVVAMTPGADWYEGYHSLLDSPEPIDFVRRQTDVEARQRHAGNWYLERVAWFSHGFFDVAETADGLRIRDLRMGQGEHYTFTFLLPTLPHQDSSGADSRPAAVIQQPYQVNFGVALPWLRDRMLGQRLALPDFGGAAPASAVTPR